MGTVGLELVQRGKVTGITGEGSSQDEEGYDELQTYFCQLYPNLLTRIEKNPKRLSKSRTLRKTKTVQQKGCRVPISLHDKRDKEIDRLIKKDTS